MKRNALIISLLSFFCMTTQAQQIEIFEPAMMEVEYNKKMVRDTLNREMTSYPKPFAYVSERKPACFILRKNCGMIH